MSVVFGDRALRSYLELADHLVWRDVQEFLPADLEEVLAYLSPKNVRLAYRVGGAWVTSGTGEHLDPTFWLPLPPGPKPDEELRCYDEQDAIERAAAGITLGEVKE